MGADDHVLGEVLRDILARMAFLAGAPVERADLPPVEGPVLVRMGFEGARRGDLALALPSALCTRVAANLLGLEDDDPGAEAVGLEAARELLNVTCGHVLVALLGDQLTFELSMPAAGPLHAGGWEELLRADGCVGLLVEDEHPVLLRVAMEP
jgi:hypothetical protein